MSPRRWGKTSLVNRVAKSASGKERIIVQMDIFACRSEYDFYNTFSSAILKQTASKTDEWKDLTKGFIERLTPKKFFPFRRSRDQGDIQSWLAIQHYPAEAVYDRKGTYRYQL